MAIREEVYRGTKKALAETLETVETNPMDASLSYDPEGRLIEIIKTDLVTTKKKRIRIEYDPLGRIKRITKEWI